MNQLDKLPSKLAEMERSLRAVGWVSMSPWWIKTIAKAYKKKPRNVVVRGGRRGGKSTSVCRIAVYEAVYGDHDVPEGDTGYFAIISAERDQAKERLDTCKKILEALDIPHKATADKILIGDRNTGIRVFTASTSGVVSFTSIGGLCDEEARWRDKDSGSNPAKEVLASLRPTMATQKNARLWHVSSPWSTLDVHHKMVERGDISGVQLVFCAPTWVMNPTLTEKMTRELEPDEPSWVREYKAIPMAADETKFFNAAHIDAALTIERCGTVADRIVAGGDFAFRRDAAAEVTVGVYGEEYCVEEDLQLVPGEKPLVPSKTVSELAGAAKAIGADCLACDLHYIETVREVLDDIDLTLLEFPTQPEEIAKAYVRTRVLIGMGALSLANASPLLIDQLKNTTVKPTTGAGLSIENKRRLGSHGDLVSALVCAIWAAGQDLPLDEMTTGSRLFAHGDEDRSQVDAFDHPEGWDD